jgi:large subunit ribosomal protein L24
MFIDASNVAIVCKSCGKQTRIGHRGEGTEKVRICRKCEAEL